MVKLIDNPLKPTTSGRCRYCRCTYYNACEEGCEWIDRQHTVCSTPNCLFRWCKAMAALCRRVDG